MLQEIRPYCGLIIYLLLVSYASNICKPALDKLYYSVAYTASVLNLSAGLWSQSDSHNHSQEITFAELQTLLENQEEERQENHTVTDLPNKKVKYFNPLEYVPLELISINNQNYFIHTFKSDSFQLVEAPPPKS